MRQPEAMPPLKPAERLQKYAGWLAAALALASFFLELFILLTGYEPPGKPRWPEAALVVTVTLTTVAALTRHLPLQNVLLAAGVIGFIGGAAHAICVITAIPFGPVSFTGAGPKLFGILPWSVPVLWVIVILNSRGVARLILRPWRKLRAYGFWLIGVTATLTVLFDFALEPFATRVKHFWLWQETKFPVTWHGTPLTNFPGWLVTALIILAFVAPALINKQVRPRQSPPDYHPLVVWVLAMALFAAGAATEKLWTACAASIVIALVVTIFAIRGARW